MSVSSSSDVGKTPMMLSGLVPAFANVEDARRNTHDVWRCYGESLVADHVFHGPRQDGVRLIRLVRVQGRTAVRTSLRNDERKTVKAAGAYPYQCRRRGEKQTRCSEPGRIKSGVGRCPLRDLAGSQLYPAVLSRRVARASGSPWDRYPFHMLTRIFPQRFEIGLKFFSRKYLEVKVVPGGIEPPFAT